MQRARSILLVSLVGLARVASAQDYPVFPGEQTVLLGFATYQDMDGDALPDGITSAGPSSPLDPLPGFLLARGHGNGTFGAPIQIKGAVGDVLLGDVDGDGMQDVVVIDGSAADLNPVIRSFVNQGSDQFSPPVTTVLLDVGSVDGAQLVDLNEDGRADLFAGIKQNPYQKHWIVARSAGDGSFDSGVTLATGALTYSVTGPFEDFDLDGHLDLLTFDGANFVPLSGTGSGVDFTPGPATPAPQVAALLDFPYAAAADFDQDGVPDLAIDGMASYPPVVGRALQYRGNGDGTFAFAQAVQLTGFGALVAGDLDGDSIPDVLITSGILAPTTVPQDAASTLFTNASGAWSTESLVLLSSDPPQIVDINADGHADIATPGHFLLGHGDGTFVERLEVSVGERPSRIACADMNGDARLDLVAALDPKDAHTLAVSLGDGAGGFGPATLVDLGVDAAEFAVGDLDGDAAADVVTGTGIATTGPLDVWLNGGDGSTFTGLQTLGTLATSTIRLGDFDNDGAADIVAAGPDATLPLFLNAGAGHFAAGTPVAAGGKPRALTLADVDADGNLDIVSACYGKQLLDLLLGTGDGHFAAAQPIPLGTRPTGVVAADLNGDGLLDLAATAFSFSEGISSLSTLIATAPATFAAPTVLAQGPDVPGLEFAHLTALDADRDGRMDLLLGTSPIGLFRGLPAGGFAPPRRFWAGLATDMNSADLDADGFPELALAAHDDSSLVVLPNITSSFPNLGFQKLSSIPAPQLVATGKPHPDAAVSFTVAEVTGPAAGFLFVGVDEALIEFHGGTLVPTPEVAVAMVAGATVGGRWPELPAGTAVFVQGWFVESGEVAASNALVAVTQ